MSIGAIQSYKVGQSWYVVRNLHTLESDGINGTASRRSERVRIDFEAWDGQRWVRQRGMAQTFESQESADTFIDEHLEQLLGAKMA